MPPTCAQQCHLPVPTYQCSPAVLPVISAQQCCQSVPSSAASQCQLSVLSVPISVAYP
ncbi:unnamed protein product [Staurois parvus]|uniref:Uncharacterized protein n=1 Tax=Staurois parvus TaxID=386267 RepID=A0ABN9DQN3_9NEOB|nr:unnamed protein product [Staurois parvus]